MQELHIGENDAGQRFDKYLKKLLAEAPGSFVYKMLRKKNITLNGKKADGTEKLSCGDEVKLFLSDETYEKFRAKSKTVMPEAFSGSEKTLRQLKVLYEDADILIINKPSGMLSQKARPEDVSANEYILSYLLREGALTEEEMRRFNFKQGDSEGFVNYPLSIRGINLSAMFIETHRDIRVSLRSRGDVDVNVFARRYFGGGEGAAGGKSFVTMEETIRHFERSVREYFGELPPPATDNGDTDNGNPSQVE